MFVKICGNTNLADAELAVELGADALGFIFAPSRRRVSAEQVAAITPHLPPGIERVGIFVEPDAAEIVRTVRAVGLTAVQMHMPQDPALLQQLSAEFKGEVQLWQVLGFAAQPADPNFEQKFMQLVLAALTDSRISAVLVDTVKNGASGGLGETFLWSRAAPLLRTAQEMAAEQGRRGGYEPAKLLIAGGLTAENVGEAIATLHPWGVDAVSGVEESPGHKNPAKLRAFLRSARA